MGFGYLSKILFVCHMFPTLVFCEVFSTDDEQRVIALVESTISCKNIPGLTLSVVKGSETWTKGFGFADISKKRQGDETTLFMTGSLGKAFTATLLGILLEEKGYDWNTKLVDIEGVDLEFNSEKLTQEVTLTDLLSHRTGLTTVTDYGFIGGYPKGVDNKFLMKRLKYMPSESGFRTTFGYNNMMYVALGYITEILGNDYWENLLTSRLLEPIGMTSTFVIKSDDDVLGKNSAKPYIMKDDTFQNSTYGIYTLFPLQPAGLLISNAVDFAKWLRFNLKKGKTDSSKVLINEERFNQVFKTQIDQPAMYKFMAMKRPTFPVDEILEGYGYGWFTSTYRGHRRSYHSGGLFSYISLIWLYNDDDIAMFASVNGPGTPNVPLYALNAIFSYISDILLGEETWLSPQTGCTFPSPWRNLTSFEISKPKEYNASDDLKHYVGRYGNMLLPDLEVSLAEDGENLKMDWNKIKGELLPQHGHDNFSLKLTEPWEFAVESVVNENFTYTYPVYFQRNADLNVESFVVALDNKVNVTFEKDVWFYHELPSDEANNLSSLSVGLLWLTLLVHQMI